MGKLQSSDMSPWQEAENYFQLLTYQSLGAMLTCLSAASFMSKGGGLNLSILKGFLSVLGKEVSFSLFISLSLPGYVAERARSKAMGSELRLHSSYGPANHSDLLSASLDLSSQPAHSLAKVVPQTEISTDKVFPSYCTIYLTYI